MAGARPGIYSGGYIVTSYSADKAQETESETKPSVTYIEYIESTGTQYIDTGYTPNLDTVWTVEMEYTKPEDGKNLSNGMIVKSADGTYNRFYFGMATTKSYQVGIGTAYKGMAFNNCRSFKLYGSGKGLVNTTEILLEKLTPDNSLSLRLFSRNSNVGSITRARVRAKLYRSVIYEGDTLIQELKPCKDEKGVICLYDTVTGKYFYNQGTGGFLCP